MATRVAVLGHHMTGRIALFHARDRQWRGLGMLQIQRMRAMFGGGKTHEMSKSLQQMNIYR